MSGRTDELREAIFTTYEALADSIGSLSDLLGAFTALAKEGVVPDKELVSGAEAVVLETNQHLENVRRLIKKGREG